MSKTPRTDAELKFEAFFDGAGIVETVLVEFAEQLEKQLAEAQAEVERLRLENASLMFIVKNQRCCRNCGNHWSANFEVCGLGEDTVTGRYCREHDLIHWRPMEYRRAKEAAERGK